MKRNNIKFSLQIVFASIISLSLLIIFTLFGYRVYVEATKGMIEKTEHSAYAAAQIIDISISSQLNLGETILKTLHNNSVVATKSESEHLKDLPTFTDVLQAYPMCEAIYIAYENEDFYFFRRNTGKMPVTPPKNTEFIVAAHHINQNGQLEKNVYFYSKDLTLVGVNSSLQVALDPRQRNWYKQAMASDTVVSTRAYVFSTQTELGITMAHKTKNKQAVIAIDINTNTFDDLLTSLRTTPHTELAIVDKTNEITAYSGQSTPNRNMLGPDGSYAVKALGVSAFTLLADIQEKHIEQVTDEQGKQWFGIVSPLDHMYGNEQRLFIAIPSDELFTDIRERRTSLAVLAVIVASAFIVGGWILGHWLARPLAKLTKQAYALKQFNFGTTMSIPSHFKEVYALNTVMNEMSLAIDTYQQIFYVLNQEQDIDEMLKNVLSLILSNLRSNNGAIYLNQNSMLHAVAVQGPNYPSHVKQFDLHTSQEFIDYMKQEVGPNTLCSFLKDRDNNLIGVLCVTPPFNVFNEFNNYLDSIAKMAAVAVEMRQYINTQKALVEGIIRMIAKATDTKSHHTGGHCDRVPELSIMIAKQVNSSTLPAFKDFALTEQEKEEFKMAVWLHDCGKLITPDHIMEKGTKLETVYNRIHELRMRFEVLHRDATIQRLETIIAGGNAKTANEQCKQKQQQLQDDFAFVAQCNIGNEGMSQEAIVRLAKIGKQVWVRHFDNTLGLSRAEQERCKDEPTTLPVQEQLIANSPREVIPWGDAIPPVQPGNPQNVYNFNMQLPPHKYNGGELYNLSVTYGTLTDEERFIINDHVIQTRYMLSSLLWPKGLAKIPDIASKHHETLIGTGYPCKLTAKEMSTLERIVPLADIFEALTATDRPYKSGKTLSQALEIIASMVAKGLLDKNIFSLMLQSDVLIHYAQKYMQPSQIDTVDINALLEKIAH